MIIGTMYFFKEKKTMEVIVRILEVAIGRIGSGFESSNISFFGLGSSQIGLGRVRVNLTF